MLVRKPFPLMSPATFMIKVVTDQLIELGTWLIAQADLLILVQPN
jgi:hypothetical protein